MAKARNIYMCQSCGNESPQWLGQCLECGEWNTYVETVVSSSKSKMGFKEGFGVASSPTLLSKVKGIAVRRVSSGLVEFDRVLGGGFVPGQVILLAGEPGIGKSTLITQIAKSLDDKKVLYVCGEESVSQIKIRADRMDYKSDNLLLLSETDVDLIINSALGQDSLALVVVDSIQTMVSTEYMGLSGSVGQVRGCTQSLANMAKKISVPIILVGHVTKEGTVAGPKVLEHIVDTVLYLEGDFQHVYRILRTAKNRFGSVSEVGVFEMVEKGMDEVKNPSKMFLSEKIRSSGSCVTVVMEGFRPILFEIQALTAKTSFGYPRRTASGFNVNRLQVLIAILEKRCGLNLSNYDVYVNVAGGLKVSEYAADLAVCLAIASSVKDRPVKEKVAAFGECGLSGEVRKVSHLEKRVKEANKLGYTMVISPRNVKTLKEAVDLSFK